MRPERLEDLGNVRLNVGAGILVTGFFGAVLQSRDARFSALVAGLSLVWFVGFLFVGLMLKEYAIWKRSFGVQ